VRKNEVHEKVHTRIRVSKVNLIQSAVPSSKVHSKKPIASAALINASTTFLPAPPTILPAPEAVCDGAAPLPLFVPDVPEVAVAPPAPDVLVVVVAAVVAGVNVAPGTRTVTPPP
jgi:hypothetical protein